MRLQPLPSDLAGSAGAPALAKRGWRSVVKEIARPRWTVLFFLIMAAGALWVSEGGGNPTMATVPPLTLLVLNLLAAIVSTPRFRADLPLLTFHLALLAFVVLLVAARLCYLDATFTLSDGGTFIGKVNRETRGPLHGNDLAALRFQNDGLIDSNDGDRRINNSVRWWDTAGNSHVVEIGQDRPLVLDGYRIYPTRRGFAPKFFWQGNDGRAEFGNVQLDYVGSDGFGSSAAWRLPGGQDVWVMMDMEAIKRTEGTKRVVPGAQRAAYPLVLRMEDARYEVKPGESIDLPGGRLVYAQLDTWVGYRISYDPTMPWLIATVVAAVGSLLWFYGIRMRPARTREQEE